MCSHTRTHTHAYTHTHRPTPSIRNHEKFLHPTTTHDAAGASRGGCVQVRRIKKQGNAFKKIALFASLTSLLETTGFISVKEADEEVPYSEPRTPNPEPRTKKAEADKAEVPV